jgi:hypothetical protein
MGKCLAKKFDVEDDGKGFAKFKPTVAKSEDVKASGYETVFKSIAKSDSVGYVKYEKNEKGIVINEVYSPFAGKATPANAGAFDVVKENDLWRNPSHRSHV